MKPGLTLMGPVIPQKLPLSIKTSANLRGKVRTVWSQQTGRNLYRCFADPRAITVKPGLFFVSSLQLPDPQSDQQSENNRDARKSQRMGYPSR